jgi:hypothetical protein
VVDDVADEAADGVDVRWLRLEDPPENVNRNQCAVRPKDVLLLIVVYSLPALLKLLG